MKLGSVDYTEVDALSDGSDSISVSVVGYSDSNWTTRKCKPIDLVRLAKLIKIIKEKKRK